MSALLLRSTASLDADILPIMLGNGINLDAARAISLSGFVSANDDYSGLLFAPAAPAADYTPSIVTEAGTPHIAFALGRNFQVGSFTQLSGATEHTGFIVARVGTLETNGTLFSWDAFPSATSSINRGIHLRRDGGNVAYRLILDFGSVTAQVTVAKTTAGWVIITYGWSKSDNLIYLGEKEVESPMSMGGYDSVTGDGPLTIGANTALSLRAQFDMRLWIGFNQKLTQAQRAGVRAELRKKYNMSA